MARSDAGQRPEALPVARAGCYCTVVNSPAVSPLPTATYRCRCQSLTASSMIYDHVSTNFPEGVEARQVDMVLGGLLPREVIEMRTAAIRRARARIVGARICVMAAAQAASLGVPSLSPMT